MPQVSFRTSIATAVLGVGFMLVAVAPAGAAKSPYPPLPEERTFGTSAAGWTAETDVAGLGPLCIAPLTCPTIDTTFEPNGGIGGGNDGHLRVAASGLAEVTTQVTSTWTSPAFTYRGANGKDPDGVTFAMARRTDAEALVQVLNDETYSVFLNNADLGVAIGLIEDAPLTSNDSWQITTPAPVDENLLDRGSRYSLSIVTEFEVPVGVIPGGSFDYDNVVLVAFNEDKAEERAKEKCQKAKRDLKKAKRKQKRAKKALRKARRQDDEAGIRRAKRKLDQGRRAHSKAVKLGKRNCGG